METSDADANASAFRVLGRRSESLIATRRIGRVFQRSIVRFRINDILPKGRVEMNGKDKLIIHAISYIR